MTKSLIEALARKTLRDMKDAPERSMRNFIDLGVLFMDGSFRDEFLKTVQELLQDEKSAYYQLAGDVVHHVEDEYLLTFGMNIGYEGCTLGASTIRKIEDAEGFDIPWSLYLEIDDETYGQRKRVYERSVRQGKRLGIHTYLLLSDRRHEKLLPMISENKDCNFVLFCDPETVTESMLDEMAHAYNLMLVIRYSGTSDAASRVCARLRRRRMLYSVYLQYTNDDAVQLTEEYPWCETQQLHPILTVLLPAESCSMATHRAVYHTVNSVRKAQKYATVPWDGYADNSYIDSVISKRSCVIGFDARGYLHTAERCKREPEFNLFEEKLKAILKRAFPKGKRV